MIIIVSKEGQLANRLAHASAFIANALAYEYKLVHCFFEDYYPYFSESLQLQKKILRVPFKKKKKIIRFFQGMISLFMRGIVKLRITHLPFLQVIDYMKYEQGIPVYNLNDDTFIEKAKSKIVLVHGWMFRDRINQLKYRNYLVKIFTPNKEYISRVDHFYSNYRKRNDVLIGVHIRRGDYRKFNNGVWFYELSDYYNKMKEIAALSMFSGKKIGFVICSDEKQIDLIPDDNFEIYFEERHFIVDLYLLAKCDYIIGPPSTFSIWASFYGSVPLYMIKDKALFIGDDNFRPEVSYF